MEIIGDPIGGYYEVSITKYMYMEKILPRRMSTTAGSFASHFGQEMAQNADLPISCKNFSGATPPNPRPVLGRSVSRFPLFRLTQLSDSSRAPAYVNLSTVFHAFLFLLEFYLTFYIRLYRAARIPQHHFTFEPRDCDVIERY